MMPLREFFKDRFKIGLIFFLLALYGILFFVGKTEKVSWGKKQEVVHFFYHPQCSHCREQIPFNQKLAKKYPSFTWVYHDVSLPQERSLLFSMAQERRIQRSAIGIPTTFLKQEYFVGFDSAENMGLKIESALKRELAGGAPSQVSDTSPSLVPTEIKIPFFGKIETRHYSLGSLAVILGLVDGFNPCAMWVLVYLISIVATLKDRTKTWVLVGSFVFASGVLYFLFLSAWLNAFLLIGYLRPVTLAVGLFAMGVGLLNLREFFTTKGEIVCEMGEAGSKKKTMTKIAKIVGAPLNLAAVGGIILLALVVNSIEFVCSAGIPAIFTHLLSLAPLSRWQYYGYLFLYDLFFMLDDLVIFGLAAFAVQSTLGVRYVRWGKLVGGILLFGLGILLTFVPHLLR